MQLNAEDGGSRQCILVTNNENNIAEEVCYERNRRVIHGYTNAKGKQVAGLRRNNLRYYRTGFVSREKSLENKRELTQLSTGLLCIKENCYIIANTSKYKLPENSFRLFKNPTTYMMVIYDPEYIEELVNLINELDKPCKVYIFAPGSFTFDDDFDDVAHKIELCPLPEAIYRAYQNILPEKA